MGPDKTYLATKNIKKTARQRKRQNASLEVPEVDGGRVSGTHGLADLRHPPGLAAVGVVLPVGQAAEHGLAPGRADHQVRDGGLLGGQGVAEGVDAAERFK